MSEPAKQEAFRPSVYWYVTFKCNLACKHCWVESGPNDCSESLAAAELEKAVDNVLTIAPGSVILSGGEPFMYPELPRLVEALSRRKTHIFVVTNATMIEQGNLLPFIAARKQGIRLNFGVSVDGGLASDHDFLRGEGAFERAIRGIGLLKANHFPVNIQCVINKHNAANIQHMVKLAEELDIATLVFAFLHPVGRALDNAEKLELNMDSTIAALEKILAASETSTKRIVVKIPPALIPPRLYPKFAMLKRAGRLSITTSCNFPLISILPDGKITICAITRDIQGANFGNILRNDLACACQKGCLSELRNCYVNVRWLEGICSDCVFNQNCKGSCRAWPFEQCGRFSAAHPLCQEQYKAGEFPAVYMQSHYGK